MFEYKYHNIELTNYSFLITGGAGFIGSNLVEYLLKYGAKKVRVLDNFSTGSRENISKFNNIPSFELFEGDIRDLGTCQKSVESIDYVLHQAALGSVPRSITDPALTNEVNINGFLNMIIASRDAKVKRFIYAASSSTYGDSKELPKIEERIGRPLSPYAITKYVNELYADVFTNTYGIETIGLRYFNVFGQRQSPNGAYAAVIPKFVLQLIKHEAPLINGDGNYSRDFTYIDNVIQANILAVFTEKEESINTVYNVAYGERTTLNQLVEYLIEYLSEYDAQIGKIKATHGPNRIGDIPHSLASVEKASIKLHYKPNFDFKSGLKEAVKWYWENRG